MSQNNIKVGDTTSFMINGKMVPFEIEKICGTLLKIRSLDLTNVAGIHVDSWVKQKKLLEA